MSGSPGTSAEQQEGGPAAFDPTAKPANEYQKGALFAHIVFMRQYDTHVPLDQITARHQASMDTWVAAAHTDGERDFARGYTTTLEDHLATLRGVQRAEAELDADPDGQVDPDDWTTWVPGWTPPDAEHEAG